jgi:hypothetical protein
MDTKVYPKEVCEQLARELVKEQTEVAKHQSMVEGLKNAIFEKKKDVIMRKIDGRSFKLNGKKVVAVKISLYHDPDGLSVWINFVENPFCTLIRSYELTTKEKKLFHAYVKAFEKYQKQFYDEDVKKRLLDVIDELSKLKHQLKMGFVRVWSMTYDEALDPDFFVKSGLHVPVFKGVSPEEKLLEDLYCLK